MADRDWEKELAEIDRRIAAEPADAAAASRAAPRAEPPAAPPARALPSRAAPAPAAPSRVAAEPRATLAGTAPVVAAPRAPWRATLGLLVRLVLAAGLLAAVAVWPYETRCGPWLAGYLATIGLAALASVWTAVASWRHRGALTHVAALGIFAGAAFYGAREILPRVGYAMPDPAHPTIWVCQ